MRYSLRNFVVAALGAFTCMGALGTAAQANTVYTYTGALYTSFNTGCLNNPKTGPCVPNPNAAIDALIFGTRLTGSVTFRFDTTGVSGKFDNFGNDIGLTQFVSGGFFWSGPIVHVTLANRKPLRDSQTPAINPPR